MDILSMIQLEGGYPVITFSDGSTEFLHKIIANVHCYEQKITCLSSMNRLKNKFMVVHHKDFNKLNFMPNNLVWMGENDHWRYHSNLMKSMLRKKWSDLAYRKTMISRNKINARKLWSDPNLQKSRDIRNAGASISMIEKWKDEDYREKVISRRLEVYATDKYKQDKSKKSKRDWDSRSDKERERLSNLLSERNKATWKDPVWVDNRRRLGVYRTLAKIDINTVSNTSYNASRGHRGILSWDSAILLFGSETKMIEEYKLWASKL